MQDHGENAAAVKQLINKPLVSPKESAIANIKKDQNNWHWIFFFEKLKLDLKI